MLEEVVTKMDAAVRQLNCAIELYFHDEDPVPIHTLACAAHQIIHDINRKSGAAELLFDATCKAGSEGKELLNAMRKHANYFKHADVDSCPNCGIRFSPNVTEVIIYSAIVGLCQLNQKLNALISAYILYMQTHSGLSLNEHWCQFEIKTKQPLKLEKLQGLSKGIFLEKCISEISRI
jgi:hypothetical protein